ncbi:MAG: CpsD/CapB family tyrosine-protein kinase, partial [Chloroflexi bacterium]|nr:CpsD/CapB family tyrosine-protein kinase [Chloroflexota bacterium]
LLGLLIGLIVAAALAVLIEELDDRLRAPVDVAELAGGPPLAVLGRIRRHPWRKAPASADLVTLSAPRSTHAEAFRTLRTSLRFAVGDRLPRSVLITSAGPSEGKTLVASNLAVALAQAGHRVLLVDGDLRRPGVHRVFGVENRTGLLNVLQSWVSAPGEQADDHRVVRGIVQSGVDNLSLLPAGRGENASSLLGAGPVGDLVKRLADMCDVLVIDSAPVGPVADSLMLAARTEGALVVARAARTRRGSLRDTIALLRQTGCPVLGVVLNDLHLGPLDRYTYQYYYGRSYYYGTPDSGANGAPAAVGRRIAG